MANIVWMQDFNPLMGRGEGVEGGSQLTDRAHIVEGLKRGHDISILTPENQNVLKIYPDDLVVMSNPSRFDPVGLSRLPNPYVVFHHDHWFRCKYRLFMPMSEKCLTDCPQAPVYEPILAKAKLHIFLSPLHHQVTKERFGDSVEPHILVPSPVNPDIFIDQGRPDRKDTVNLNGLLMYKGRTTILEYAREHPEEKITFAGANDRPGEPLPENCSYVGPVTEGMVDFYNQFERYLELPNTPQPFNRSVAEAYLSGCKIRGNSLVGALSWPWFKDGRKTVAERLRRAPEEFWNGVEAIL